MTVRECYISMGADYESTIRRISNEALVAKYMLIFLEDTSFARICREVGKRRFDRAILPAHTLKGMALSLGFTFLSISAEELGRALRSGQEALTSQAVERLEGDYRIVTDAITRFKSEAEAS